MRNKSEKEKVGKVEKWKVKSIALKKEKLQFFRNIGCFSENKIKSLWVEFWENTVFQTVWPESQFSVCVCTFLTWGRVGSRWVARLCCFPDRYPTWSDWMIWIPGHILRDMIRWFGYLVISCGKWLDDADSWPESQRDGLDDLVPYLAADLFSTWFFRIVWVCACVPTH